MGPCLAILTQAELPVSSVGRDLSVGGTRSVPSQPQNQPPVLKVDSLESKNILQLKDKDSKALSHTYVSVLQ